MNQFFYDQLLARQFGGEIIGFSMYSGSVLDRVLFNVAEDLGKDADFVARFKKMTLEKVEELLPITAAEAAKKVCDRARDDSGYHNSDLSRAVTERISVYFNSPEGKIRLDESIQKAIDETLTGSAVSSVVERWIGERMGILAKDAVVRAIESERKKSDRKAKKLAKGQAA